MFFEERKLVYMNCFGGHFDCKYLFVADSDESQFFVHLWNDWTL